MTPNGVDFSFFSFPHVCGLAAFATLYTSCQLLWHIAWQCSHRSLRSLTQFVSATEIKLAAQDCQVQAVSHCIAMADTLPGASYFKTYTSTCRHHQQLLARLHALLARHAAGEAWPCSCPCPWLEWMVLHHTHTHFYTPDMTFTIATMPTCILLHALSSLLLCNACNGGDSTSDQCHCMHCMFADRRG